MDRDMDTNICFPLTNGKVDNTKKSMLIEAYGELCIDKLYGRCTRIPPYLNNMKFTMRH